MQVRTRIISGMELPIMASILGSGGVGDVGYIEYDSSAAVGWETFARSHDPQEVDGG